MSSGDMRKKRTHTNPPASYIGYVLAGVGVCLLFRKWKGMGGDPVDVSAEAYEDMMARADMTGERSKLTARDKVEKLGPVAEQMMVGGGYTTGQILDARSSWLKKNAPGQFPALEALTSQKLTSITSRSAKTTTKDIPKKESVESGKDLEKLLGLKGGSKVAQTQAIALPPSSLYRYTPDGIEQMARFKEAMAPVLWPTTPRSVKAIPESPEKERSWIDPSIAAEATALALEDLRRTPRGPVGITYVPEGRTESVTYVPEKKADITEAIKSAKAPTEDIAMKMGADLKRRIAETQSAMRAAQQAAMRAVQQTSLTQAQRTAAPVAQAAPMKIAPPTLVASAKPKTASSVVRVMDTAPQQALPVFDSAYTS